MAASRADFNYRLCYAHFFRRILVRRAVCRAELSARIASCSIRFSVCKQVYAVTVAREYARNIAYSHSCRFIIFILLVFSAELSAVVKTPSPRFAVFVNSKACAVARSYCGNILHIRVGYFYKDKAFRAGARLTELSVVILSHSPNASVLRKRERMTESCRDVCKFNLNAAFGRSYLNRLVAVNPVACAELAVIVNAPCPKRAVKLNSKRMRAVCNDLRIKHTVHSRYNRNNNNS